MKKPILLCLTFLITGIFAHAQSLEITLVGNPDTTGLSVSEQLALERRAELQLTPLGGGSDTLVVEMGTEVGSYDLFVREFSLAEVGIFEDGSSLFYENGLTVGLGRFTGLSSFFVRTYLKSAGVGSAIFLNNN